MGVRKQRARRAGRLEAGGIPAARKESTAGEQTTGRGFAARAGIKSPGSTVLMNETAGRGNGAGGGRVKRRSA